MGNTKNPTYLWLQRMNTPPKNGMGTLAASMVNFFRENYGMSSLPKVVADFSIYDQQPVAAGTTRLFQGSYTPQRSNWPNGNNFIAAESEHMVVQSLRVWSAVSSSNLDEVPWEIGVNDAKLKNATFDATINGVRVLTGIPLTAFDSGYMEDTVTAGRTDEDRGRFYLMEPLVILGQTGININLNLNTGVAPTANSKIRVELEGQRFIGN